MALTFVKLFSPTQLAASVGVIYTCPATPNTSVLKNGRARFTNTTAGPITVTAYAVNSAGSPTAANAFLNAKSIAANDYLDIDLPTLGSGDTFQAFASAATSITCTELGGVLFS